MTKMKKKLKNWQHEDTGYITVCEERPSERWFEIPMPSSITCYWKHDNFNDTWETECSNEFKFIDGRPEENNFKFCPYCGKNIQIKKELKNE